MGHCDIITILQYLQVPVPTAEWEKREVRVVDPGNGFGSETVTQFSVSGLDPRSVNRSTVRPLYLYPTRYIHRTEMKPGMHSDTSTPE
jgi:hypothetical protein